MTKAEMREILVDLGWSQAELSRRLSIRPSTVAQWPEEKIPGPAAAYLRVKMLAHRMVGL